MKENVDEEQQLRDVTLQNAMTIFLARRRAEEELVRTKEALELKTQELAHSLAMMRATLESTSDGILVTDGCGRVTDFNRQYTEIWRLPAEVMDSREHRQLLELSSQQFDDPGSFLARTEAIYAASPSESYDLLELVDGRSIERFSRIQYIEGRNVGRVWSFCDVTERRRLEVNTRRLAAIVESSDDAIISKDLNGIVTSWNQAAERIYGYSAEEMVGQPIALLVPPDRPDEEPQILERLRRGERIDHFETVRLRKDGRRLDVSVTISPIRDEEGRIIGASKVARDITLEKALRAEIERRVAELAEIDRAKDEFLAMLAHELRNPLGPIRNATQLLKQLGPAEPRLIRAREIIERQLKHQSRLLDDLLDVSRITQGKINLRPLRLDLGQLVHDTAEDLRSMVETAGLALTLTLPEAPIWVEGDPTRLAQILTNLLNNSTKFTDPGGEVSVQLTLAPTPDRALLTVRDTGIGIEPPMLARVFDTFAQADRTLDRSRGGLGLGLALVKGLVKLHSGEVRAESEGPGKGTTFVLTFPTASTSEASPGPAPRPVSTGPLRVLIVEDNRDAAESLRDLLELSGCTVALAFSGPEALAAAPSFCPEVVLCDLGLPGMTGYEVGARLREEPGLKNTRLIAVSGYGQEEDQRRSREAGFDLHLTKPVDFEELWRLLPVRAAAQP